MFGDENNGNGIEFIELQVNRGKAKIGGSEIEFILESTAYFGMSDGKPDVYAIEEDMFGVDVPFRPKRLEITLPATCYDGTIAKIRNALVNIYDLYQREINERKSKENKI